MKLHVVMADLDTSRLLLYYIEKGEVKTYRIPQGDKRLKPTLDMIQKPILENGFADIDLGSPENIYDEFNKAKKGSFKFMKVLKSVVSFFTGESDSQIIGRIPDPTIQEDDKMPKAVEDILQHAQPIQGEIKPEETVVAVCEDSKTVIPDADKLQNLVAHSNRIKNTEGVENLIQRLGVVIKNRQHSVQDTMTFLEKSDLPLMNNGSILAYKVLRTTSESGVYVDKHTGKVKQRVGSIVFVNPSLVDHNRGRECSNGLHIARRRYLSGFYSSSDVIVLCIVHPEDIIAVPHGDANKVRVCRYQIIGLLPRDQYNKITQNIPFTEGSEASKMLAAAIEGEYVDWVETVEITEQYGGGLKITPREGAELNEVDLTEVVAAETVDDLKDVSLTAPKVNPTAIAEEVTDAKPRVLTNKEKANELWAKGDLEGLLELKKKSKQSWIKLGIHETEIELLKAQKGQSVLRDAEPSETEQIANLEAGKTVSGKPVLDLEGKTTKEIAHIYYDNSMWVELFALKKQKKVSWDRLGFSETEQEDIRKNIS